MVYCRLIFLSLIFGTANLWAMPKGLVEVYSAYTDIKTHQVQIVKGYGYIFKFVFESTAGQATFLAVQTASHLSQGRTSPSDVARVTLRIPRDNEPPLFAYYKNHSLPQELQAVVGQAESAPLLHSSFVSNVKDSEMIVLDPEDPNVAQIPPLVEIHVRGGQLFSYELKIDPVDWFKERDGWRLKKVRGDLGILCPTRFPSCAKDDENLKTQQSPQNALSKNILNLGFIQTEYDWLLFTRADQGMSGLPVLHYMPSAGNENLVIRPPSGLVAAVMGSISSSSRVSDETWVLLLDPLDTFLRWVEFQQNPLYRNKQVFSELLVTWELKSGLLRRTLRGPHHTYIEWSPDADEKSLRCQNGGAFRFDNGDVEKSCSVRQTAFGKGGFQVQRDNGPFRRSNLLVVSHPSYTRIAPATVAGMALSQFTKEYDMLRLQRGVYGGMSFVEYLEEDRQVEWRFFKDLFSSFYQSVAIAPEDQKALDQAGIAHQGLQIEKFTSSLDVSKLSRQQSLTDSKGQLTLLAVIGKKQELVGVLFKLEFEGQAIRRWVSFSDSSQPFAPYIAVPLGQETVSLELAGMLSHNPDRLNIPDLTISGPLLPIQASQIPTGFPYAVTHFAQLRKFDGDTLLKTIFSLHTKQATYYFSVAK